MKKDRQRTGTGGISSAQIAAAGMNHGIKYVSLYSFSFIPYNSQPMPLCHPYTLVPYIICLPSLFRFFAAAALTAPWCQHKYGNLS